MAKLQELLEQDREKLLSDLREAGTPDLAESILEKECDKLLWDSCGITKSDTVGNIRGKDKADPFEEDETRKIEALLTIVKKTLPLCNSIAFTEIYEREETEAEKKAKQRTKTAFAVLLIAGISLAVLSVVILALSAPKEKLELSGMLRTIGMLSASLICLLLSGFTLTTLFAQESAGKERKTVNRIDAVKCYVTLLDAVKVADRAIDKEHSDDLAAEKCEPATEKAVTAGEDRAGHGKKR